MSKEINFLGLESVIYTKWFSGYEPYQFIKIGDIVYIRFENKNPCAIVRITKNGEEYTLEWAYGNWSSKTTLEYKPINENRYIEEN